MNTQTEVVGAQLEGVIDRIEGETAIIALASGNTITWPTNQIPSDIHEGSSITITLQSSEKASQEKITLAKSILNDILTSQS